SMTADLEVIKNALDVAAPSGGSIAPTISSIALSVLFTKWLFQHVNVFSFLLYHILTNVLYMLADRHRPSPDGSHCRSYHDSGGFVLDQVRLSPIQRTTA